MSERRQTPTAEQIAAALADLLEPINSMKRCELCSAKCKGHKTKLDEHAPTCPWRMAKEWREAR